jgi:transcriptional regulator with XRE-family HTH domain
LRAVYFGDYTPVMLDTEKLRRLREKLGLSQEAAAQQAGLANRQQWHLIESGERANVTLETLDKIATALGVKAKDLLK